jgi:O-antigen ligase
MNLDKHITNYFLILFSIIPLTIIIGSSASILNILLIDISFLVYIFYKKDFLFLKSKPIIYLFILYLYLIFNSLISYSFNESYLRNFGFIRIIILFAAFNYFFLNKNFFKTVFYVWGLIIFIVLVDVYIEAIIGKNILGYNGFEIIGSRRIVSFFKDEPIAGSYLNAFFLILIPFLFYELKKWRLFLTLFAFFLYTLAIILTGERSNSIKAFLGLIFFLAFMDSADSKKKIILVLSIIIVTIISILNSHYLKNRFFNQINYALTKNTIYFDLYQSGYEVFKNNAIFGTGNKNYRIVSCQKIDKKKIVTQKYFCNTHPHQIYLEFLSEHGIFGTLLTFFIFFKLFFSKIIFTIRKLNYIKLGSLLYLCFTFMPILPSGAFFGNFLITIFAINLSIFYASDIDSNIFRYRFDNQIKKKGR